jgi:hypothetical protein
VSPIDTRESLKRIAAKAGVKTRPVNLSIRTGRVEVSAMDALAQSAMEAKQELTKRSRPRGVST